MEAASKKMKMQIWSGVVTIVLVEGSNLMAMDDNGFSDPYVKFRLGQEKYKSKVGWLERERRGGRNENSDLKFHLFGSASTKGI